LDHRTAEPVNTPDGSFGGEVHDAVFGLFAIAFALAIPGAHAVDRKDLGEDGFWSEWSDATFERAAKEKKS
jgi:hypothetical protein